MGILKNFVAVALIAFAAPAAGQSGLAFPKVIEGADPSIWSGTVDKGPAVHLASGVAFPEELSGLKRFRLVALGGKTDVAANYRIGETTFSVYMFKPGVLPEHKLPGAIAAIGLRSPQAFVWSDGPFDVDGAQKLRLFKGTYKTGIGPDTVMDYLYFGTLGTWTVKIRATLPSPKEVAEEQRLDAAVRALPWPAILQANGTCTGTACQATRTMPFDQHMVEMILSGLLKDAAAQAKVAPGEPLFTRRDGQREWVVQPLDAKLADLFGKSFGAITVTAPLYSLSLREQGKDPAIVRFFSGVPDQALFDRTVAVLTKTPENSPFLSPVVAAAYAPE